MRSVLYMHVYHRIISSNVILDFNYCLCQKNTSITYLKNTSCSSHLTSKLLIQMFGCIRRPFWILCILQMAQVVFIATFIMLILLAIVIIAKLKVCKKLYNLKSLFQFLTKKMSFNDILCHWNKINRFLFLLLSPLFMSVLWCHLSTTDTVLMKKIIIFSPIRLSETGFWRPSWIWVLSRGGILRDF